MRPTDLLVLMCWGWLGGQVATGPWPWNGAVLPFLALTVVLGWQVYHLIVFAYRFGPPGQVAIDELTAAGYAIQEMLAPSPEYSDRLLFVHGEDEDDLLLLETGPHGAQVSSGRLTDPWTFEADATWLVRPSDRGESAVPKDLLAYIR